MIKKITKDIVGLYMVGQLLNLQLLEKSATAYSMSKPLGVSVPTARKRLQQLEKIGFCIGIKEPYRNSHRVCYFATRMGMEFLHENRERYISTLREVWDYMLNEW